MKIEIYKEEELTKDIDEIIKNNKIGIISFTDFDEEGIDFNKYKNINCFKCKLDDLWFDEIEDEKVYKETFNKIAEFVIDCSKKGIEKIICQCVHGESRSAACAAAISEFYNKDGIKIFADYRYSPNQYFFNGIYEALQSIAK